MKTLSFAAAALFAAAAWGQGLDTIHLSMDHATIGVADLQKEGDWYHRALGLEFAPIHHAEKFDVQTMTAPGVRIDLLHESGSTRPTALMGFDKQGWLHVALGTTDADALYRHLADMGTDVAATRDKKTGKIVFLSVHDPEGNNLEVMQK